MNDPEIPSVEQLRELSEARVRAQVQAAKQRAAIKDFDLDDHWAVFYRAEDVEKLPDLIDPDKQEQP